MSVMFTEQFRPYHVKDLVGQAAAQKTLQAWVKTDRVPRAILVHGPYSAGKTTIARILGRILVCSAKTDKGEACGECASCKQFDAGTHRDYIEMDAAADRGIDAMRDLARKCRMLPTMSNRRVIVLDEAHQLTAPAWEALLKTFEEPPKHVVLIPCTTNPEKIKKTILSRCQKLPLKLVSEEACVELLQRAAKTANISALSEKHFRRIARVVRNHPRDALHALDRVYTQILSESLTTEEFTSAMVASLVEEAVGSDKSEVALQMARAIAAGQPDKAVVQLDASETELEPIYQEVVEIFAQFVRYAVKSSGELVDPYFRDAISTWKVLEEINAAGRMAALDAFEALNQAVVMTAQHQVALADVAEPAVLRAALLMRAFRSSLRKEAKGPTVVEPAPVKAKSPAKTKAVSEADETQNGHEDESSFKLSRASSGRSVEMPAR